MRTRIKICGITRPEDGVAAAQLGVDAIGLVFYAPSPRVVTAVQAKSIVQTLPPFVTSVGLFVNATVEEIHQALAVVRLDLLQFHGDETPAQCDEFGLPYIKAVRVREPADVLRAAAQYRNAKALLLDAYQDGTPGGTGSTFDWSMIPAHIEKTLILAGGLNAQNVQQALAQVKPYAVDVSGGVEASKGIKDAAKMAAFVNQVNQYSEKTR